MVPASGGLPSDLSSMGNSGCGSHGVSDQQEGSTIRLQVTRSSRSGRRCSGHSLVTVRAALSVPTPSITSQTVEEDQSGRGAGHPDRPGLAQESLVRGARQPSRGRSLVPSRQARSAVPGSDLPPEFSVAQFNGVAVETAVLRASGLSDRVIHTMIQARKPSSSRIYYRTWKAYFRWCESNRVPPMVFSLPSLLAFLQAGLDSGLALSSLKGQVSALSILFQKTLASRPQVKTFFQGVAHAVPPYRAPVEAWDLNLVLDVLKVSPFEPLREIPLSVLSWKVAFLVAITSIRRVSELAALSCRPPFLVIHQDKVVFRPPPSFLPKVVSTFHLNEDIVLPSFCPAPTHPLERSLNKLDLVRAVRIYLDRTSSFRKTDSFFVIPDGTRRGQPASKATIARWIRTAILEAYRVKNRVPPPGIKAHSTRAVGASWAVHHRASALQLCKAATWSSIHTFAKFYKVHTYASADASLGRRILQAAVWQQHTPMVPVSPQWRLQETDFTVSNQKSCFSSWSHFLFSLLFPRDDDVLFVSDGESCVDDQNEPMITEPLTGGQTDWLTLNVGGRYFTTTRSTLVSKEPDSMLSHMFSDRDAWGNKRDHRGAFLIDRSPEYFEPILNYLRHGQLIVNDGVNLLGVLEEAKFFGIDSLIEHLELAIKNSQPAEDHSPISRKEFIRFLLATPTKSELRCQDQ
ncbi:unnamed protein product [Ranitomeya imitator]|uniref:BTB domain-containing protein n=1 Tax=Ranitomeya imitator TaxID=111125 RepID=A0ABN9KW30_9NEOB|nr:unnamed protein product [Ranitomeya imitator]